MNKFFRNYFSLYKIIVILCIYFLIPILYTGGRLSLFLVTSRYMYTGVNLVYILLAYSRINLLENMEVVLIQRLGYKKYINLHIKLAVLFTMLFLGVLYLDLFLFMKFESNYTFVIFLMLFVYLFMYLFYEAILMLGIGKKKTLIYFGIVIIINFIIRYIVIEAIIRSLKFL